MVSGIIGIICTISNHIINAFANFQQVRIIITDKSSSVIGSQVIIQFTFGNPYAFFTAKAFQVSFADIGDKAMRR